MNIHCHITEEYSVSTVEFSTMQVYGHVAESSSNYTKPKWHHKLRGALSIATMAQTSLLKGLGMPIRQSP